MKPEPVFLPTLGFDDEAGSAQPAAGGCWRDDESHWISASAEMTMATDAKPRLARDPRITQ
jgi:hypothetical protein